MNWIWSLRNRDGGMTGMEFARAVTAGGWDRVLVHAAPALLEIEVVASDGTPVAGGRLDREGEYSPMTLIELSGGKPTRREVWPDGSYSGVPVILHGGEVGLLNSWRHDPDRTWWRWTVEFSNHRSRPPDWSPPRV